MIKRTLAFLGLLLTLCLTVVYLEMVIENDLGFMGIPLLLLSGAASIFLGWYLCRSFGVHPKRKLIGFLPLLPHSLLCILCAVLVWPIASTYYDMGNAGVRIAKLQSMQSEFNGESQNPYLKAKMRSEINSALEMKKTGIKLFAASSAPFMMIILMAFQLKRKDDK